MISIGLVVRFCIGTPNQVRDVPILRWDKIVMICVIMKPRACSSVRGSIPRSLLSILRLYLSVYVYISAPVYTCVGKNVYVRKYVCVYMRNCLRACLCVHKNVYVYVRVWERERTTEMPFALHQILFLRRRIFHCFWKVIFADSFGTRS